MVGAQGYTIQQLTHANNFIKLGTMQKSLFNCYSQKNKTTHLPNMSCSHKHQQQRYNNYNTQTLQTWISHNAMCCHNFSALSHVLPQTLQ